MPSHSQRGSQVGRGADERLREVRRRHVAGARAAAAPPPRGRRQPARRAARALARQEEAGEGEARDAILAEADRLKINHRVHVPTGGPVGQGDGQ